MSGLSFRWHFSSTHFVSAPQDCTQPLAPNSGHHEPTVEPHDVVLALGFYVQPCLNSKDLRRLLLLGCCSCGNVFILDLYKPAMMFPSGNVAGQSIPTLPAIYQEVSPTSCTAEVGSKVWQTLDSRIPSVISWHINIHSNIQQHYASAPSSRDVPAPQVRSCPEQRPGRKTPPRHRRICSSQLELIQIVERHKSKTVKTWL